ncbi:alpha/beta hydrolase fold domain-containing protein [Streptococcus respiraculi]|uniref:alpha/beta hydrolase fold domain-containing protein n=1 Tax=Streptococcus respiraculi TaxID=2021971 RepID=UPI000E722C70|nr:alpha/beta hydrolase [Streptococcus respiraculi]
MLKEDLTIFEYRMEKEIKYADMIKHERLTGKSEKISYFTKEAGYVDGYIYRPSNYTGAATLPIIFNFHGGGMVLGYCEQDGKYCQYLADEVGAAVINVDYPVAPEYKYPLPIVSSFSFLKQVVANSFKYNLDYNSVSVMGHSAGGYISAALAILASKDESIDFKCMIVDYAVLRQDKNPEFRKTIDPNKAIPVSRMQQYYNWYFGPDADPSDWLASPCNAPGEIFPSTFVIIAEYDALAEEEEEFYNNLLNAGIKVKKKVYLDCMHGFTHDCFNEFNQKQSRIAWKDMVEFLKSSIKS